jgi:succinate dehydrogenase/fumarate reductase iron-sulfur protein
MSPKNGNTDLQYIFKIFRFDPDQDREPRYDTFHKQLPYGTTVLDALLNIQETDDDSLAFRFSCRSAVCGSCGMLVNGTPVLACRTQLAKLIGSQVLVEPLPNMEITKDLVVKMAPFWE